jgi:4-hydroxy-tetrahydrodipicolinate reductase
MRIAVLGAAGRMGQTLTRVLAETPGCVVAGGIEAKGSPAVGRDIGEVAGIEPLGVAITDDPLPVFASIQGVLDFTTPASTVAFAALAAQARIVHVIGTTGLSESDEAKIIAAARHSTVVKAGNMSLGVNLLAGLTARVAEALGAEFDIEILEMHHRHKRDAPSGTSLMLGVAAAGARGISLDERGRCRRAQGDLRRAWREDRACSCRDRQRDFCSRRGQSRTLGEGQSPGPLQHERRSRLVRAQLETQVPIMLAKMPCTCLKGASRRNGGQ